MSTGGFQPTLLCLVLSSLSSALVAVGGNSVPLVASASTLRLISMQFLFRELQTWTVVNGLQWAGALAPPTQAIDTAKAVKQLSPFARGKNDEISDG